MKIYKFNIPANMPRNYKDKDWRACLGIVLAENELDARKLLKASIESTHGPAGGWDPSWIDVATVTVFSLEQANAIGWATL